MSQELLQQFIECWNANDVAPDVFAFLQEHDVSGASDQLAVLLADQRHRWQTDSPLRVEDYFARFPELASDSDCKLQLAVGEFQARQDGGTSPSIDEFATRFADISDTLRNRLSEVAAQTQTVVAESSNRDTYIGRYRLVRILGEGAFGRVWLGFDEELQRQVAIKVPTRQRFLRPKDAETFLAEARTVARLDHQNIVPVHDVGRNDDGSIYVVSKFIEGCDLYKRIKDARPAHNESAAMMARIANALNHAHDRQLIHRDVKPGNILLEDSTGIPYITDFGLAISEEDYLKNSKIAGTPAYMSPEQARGEGHRLDGRSDIFSLGVVFYELLTGNRPFRGSTPNELLHQVVSVDPIPPRQLDESIPAELERICLKSMSKRASDRYATAVLLADDLVHWQQGPTSQQEHRELKIVPKGLRSFDATDADFFLELLPGPRDRDGLPDSIRFWKGRIEETDPDNTFSVGLIYGPSGCGKSSLMKAGLLPRLSDVIAVYVEATPDDTETRILRGLRKQLPDLPDDLGLVETFTWLRRNEGPKVVIVLDQFEQWFHAHRADQELELVSALRQCDGGTLQAVVMVRDDFAMAAARFMDSLDIPILQGHNFTTVDLFDIDHAQKVLTKFGQAFGKIPARLGGLSNEEQEFIGSVVAGLAQDGKVVSVRLALFAEMVKGKPWVPATLVEVGGTEGIGVNFLEETFSSRTANPKHRLHQQAAREVLKALLPEVGTDIKGHMRSHAELLEASGYQNRPGEFNDLLRILDGELRLITPTDPEGLQTESGSDPGSKFYQLTHDYLVPSLRVWLTRKQKETRKGRAELKLAERSASWKSKLENRHLPSLLEWTGIRTFTEKKRWTEPQRKMMRKAGRFHGMRSSIALSVLVVASVTGVTIRHSILEERALVQARNAEEQNLTRAKGLVETLLKADTAQVPAIIADMKSYRKWANPKLSEAFEKFNEDSKERLHASLALLPIDPMQVDYLKSRLLVANPEDIDVIRVALFYHKGSIVDELWRILEHPSIEEEAHFLQAASALALYDSGSDRWKSVADEMAKTVVNEEPFRVHDWTSLFQPVRVHLLEKLGDIFRNQNGEFSQIQIDLSTAILKQYTADDVHTLTELIVDAQPKQLVALFAGFEVHRSDAIENLNQELDRQLRFQWQDGLLDTDWAQPDPSIVQQIEAANGLLSERFAFCQTMQLDRFVEVAKLLRKSGYRPIRFRPFTHKGSVQVAAVWTRDGRDWQLLHGLTAEAIRKSDEELRNKGLLPLDVAGYIGGTEAEPAEQYGGIWVKRDTEGEDACMYVDAFDTSHATVFGALKKEGYRFWHSLQGFRDLDGRQNYCGVLSNANGTSKGSWNQSPDSYENGKYFGRILWDIDISSAARPLSAKARSARSLAVVETELKRDPDDVVARLKRATAYFHLGRFEEFLEDATVLIAADSNHLGIYRHQTLAKLAGDHNGGDPTHLERLKQLGIGAFEAQSLEHLATTYANPDTLKQLASSVFESPIDLLHFVEPNRDSVSGKWTLLDGSLNSPNPTYGRKLQLPVSPRGAYTLTLSVTPIEDSKIANPGGLMIGLVMGKHRFQVTIDHFGLSGIENIDGKTLGGHGHTSKGKVLQSGKTSIIKCTVSSGNVTVTCDGNTIIEWEGRPESLSTNSYWATPNRKALFLGLHERKCVIHSVLLSCPIEQIEWLCDPDTTQSFALAKLHARMHGLLQLTDRADETEKAARLSIQHLKQALLKEPVAIERVIETSDFHSLRDNAAFRQLSSPIGLRYAAVWNTSTELESLETHGLSPKENLEKCKKMQANGYRIASVSAATINSKLFTASVWHRPLVSEDDKENRAKRQANAAIALLKMGKVKKVWPLLKHSPDPRLRTWIIHRLSPMGANPDAIAARLEEEKEVSIRQALILALGEYQDTSWDEKDNMTMLLLNWYSSDPDPGIHGASGWVLRRWGNQREVDAINKELATSKIEGDRRWYVVKTNTHSMSVIPGPVEFLMGSPKTEANHTDFELRHRKRIARSYAIGTTEVTVRQYRGYAKESTYSPLDDKHYLKEFAPEDDCPQNSMTWYYAARFHLTEVIAVIVPTSVPQSDTTNTRLNQSTTDQNLIIPNWRTIIDIFRRSFPVALTDFRIFFFDIQCIDQLA